MAETIFISAEKIEYVDLDAEDIEFNTASLSEYACAALLDEYLHQLEAPHVEGLAGVVLAVTESSYKVTGANGVTIQTGDLPDPTAHGRILEILKDPRDFGKVGEYHMQISTKGFDLYRNGEFAYRRKDIPQVDIVQILVDVTIDFFNKEPDSPILRVVDVDDVYVEVKPEHVALVQISTGLREEYKGYMRVEDFQGLVVASVQDWRENE